MTTCTDEARCQDYPLCGHARQRFTLDDGDTGASFWPPLCPPVPLSAPDGAGRQEGSIQAVTEAHSECPACGCPNECAEVARLLAEIDDRESERADLRDRVTKAEAALERVEDALYDHPHCIGECGCAVDAVLRRARGGRMTTTATSPATTPDTQADDITHYVCCRTGRSQTPPRWTFCGMDATKLDDGPPTPDLCEVCAQVSVTKHATAATSMWGPCAIFCPEHFLEEGE